MLVMMLSLETKRTKKIQKLTENNNPVIGWFKKQMYERA
jgi:hypothetical protein